MWESFYGAHTSKQKISCPKHVQTGRDLKTLFIFLVWKLLEGDLNLLAIFGLDCNECERVLIRFIGSNKKWTLINLFGHVNLVEASAFTDHLTNQNSSTCLYYKARKQNSMNHGLNKEKQSQSQFQSQK